MGDDESRTSSAQEQLPTTSSGVLMISQKGKQIPETSSGVLMTSQKRKQIPETKGDTIVDLRLLDKVMSMSKEEEAEEWKMSCIYRIPKYVREVNPKAYTPKFFSLGPYHHGSPHLAKMENQKHRALAHALKRRGKFFGEYFEILKPMTKYLMGSYNDLDEEWKNSPDKFLELMILDGFFFIEICIIHLEKDNYNSDYCEVDPIFSRRASPFSVIDWKDDLWMLENQLPEFFIRILEAQAPEQMVAQELRKREGVQPIEEEEPLHYLDNERREILLGFISQRRTQSPHRRPCHFYTASELAEADVTFELKRSLNFVLADLDITFDKQNGILRMGKIYIKKVEERRRMLNMVAFEHLHPGETHDISAYILFIANLIITPEDVDVLYKAGILTTGESDLMKVVQYMENLLYETRYYPKECYRELRCDITEHMRIKMQKWKKRRREWRNSLKKTYLRNPWTVSGLLTAIIILVLTLISTIYTVLGYYKQ